MRQSSLNVVCLPFHDYKIAQTEGFRTRDTHIFSHFIKSDLVENVVVINRPTLLLEIVLGKKKLLTKGKLLYKNNGVYITRVDPKTIVIDVIDYSLLGPVIDGKKFIVELYSNNINKIKKSLEWLGIREFITYESSPLTVSLCSKLPSQYRIFDGVDNLCKHPTYVNHKKAIEKLYFQAINSYQHVMFNSNDSIDYFDVSNLENVEFVANGVDDELFRKKLTSPSRFNNSLGKNILYAGKMQDLFDVELVLSLASSFPNDTFYFLGKILKKGIKEHFEGIKNVCFTGDIPYSDLPNYVANADVCIIPYIVGNQHGGDPIKFYEYMAANKAIVSTKIGEIEKYHNGKDIFVVNKVDFEIALAKALDCKFEKVSHDLEAGITWREKAGSILIKCRAYLNGQ